MAIPAATPVTTPVVAPTVAVDVAPLLQVPPGVISPKVVVAPTHMLVVPVIAAGDGLTVMGRVTVQPEPSE